MDAREGRGGREIGWSGKVRGEVGRGKGREGERWRGRERERARE